MMATMMMMAKFVMVMARMMRMGQFKDCDDGSDCDDDGSDCDTNRSIIDCLQPEAELRSTATSQIDS